MKKLFFILLVLCTLGGFSSCSENKEKTDSLQKWEYKTIEISGTAWSNFYAKDIPFADSQLNKLGEEGWELVSVYTEVHTVHPNFGNEKYVTGLQPNTRTRSVCYVFKRPKAEKTNRENDKEDTALIDSSSCPGDSIAPDSI